jgi:hypothetical protein
LSPVAERSAEGLAEPADRRLLIGAMINQQQLDEAWQAARVAPWGLETRPGTLSSRDRVKR